MYTQEIAFPKWREYVSKADITIRNSQNIDNPRLRDTVMRATPRYPPATYDPFLVQSVEKTNMLTKWKKKLTTIATNDSLTLNNHHTMLYNKEITKNCVTTEKEPKNNPQPNEQVHSDAFNRPGTSTMNQFFEERKIYLPREQQPINVPVAQSSVTKEVHPTESIQVNICQDKSLNSQLSSGSMNVLEYVADRKKSFESFKEKMLDDTLIKYSKKLKSDKQELSDEDMISKDKYIKLLNKYKALKVSFRQHRDQYIKDTQIQYLAQRLYKAIGERYSDEEDD